MVHAYAEMQVCWVTMRLCYAGWLCYSVEERDETQASKVRNVIILTCSSAS